MTLTEFLLARFTEDEEWARWAGAAQDAERSSGLAFVSSMGSSSVTSAGRVLAECEAKRRIVEMWEDNDGQPMLSHRGDLDLANGAKEMHWDVLRALALPYADHPDYREEWKP